MKRQIFAVLLAALPAAAQEPEARITVQGDRVLGAVSPRLYGQFIEHLGRCITGGIYDEGSALADAHGFRRDVLEKVRELRPAVLRYPGGTVTKIYHWEDGVGPKEARRVRPNLIWGGEEDNRFGTDEFIRYCREVGAEPFITVNMGTGTPEEAARWVEYCNATGNTHYARMRRANGFPEPHRVRLWGLGNEEEAEPDCGRLQDPAEYARVAWQYAKLMKLTDPSIQLVVVGGGSPAWNETVMKSLHPVADYFSVHWYGRSPPEYAPLFESIAALDRRLGELDKWLGSFPERVESFPRWYRFGPRAGPVKISVDEWGIWNSGKGREDLWGLEMTYTWKDALATATLLNVLQRHADRIGLATWAQMVNVLAPIRTDATNSIRQTVFHPLALYARHAGTSSLAAACESPMLGGAGTIPALDVSATRHDGPTNWVVAVVNRDPARAVRATIRWAGMAAPRTVERHTLTAASPDAANTLARSAEDCVRSTLVPAALADGVESFAPASVNLLIYR